jgi:diguanylate cyclase (GGDEF)-like protein/PAS domain S-box-containing protein
MVAKGAGKKDILDELGGDASLSKALLEGAPIGIFLVDKGYAIRYVNPALVEWLKKPAKGLLGKKCHEVLFGNKKPCKDGSQTCPTAAALKDARMAGPATFPRQTQAGSKEVLQVHAQPVPNATGTPRYAVEFIQDVTPDILLKDYREEAALRDALTGLYNRQGFHHLLGREMKRTKRQGHPLSLCLIDLDTFKDYNEKKGEEAGNALLEKLSGILVAQTRIEVDSSCRLQADTFALVLPEASHEHALRIGHRIRRAAEETKLPISFSMAICEAEGSEDADAFYHRTADVLFQAKKSGGNQTL